MVQIKFGFRIEIIMDYRTILGILGRGFSCDVGTFKRAVRIVKVLVEFGV